MESVVSAILKPLLETGADIIVLGCTHYPFLVDAMKDVAGPGIKFIDPAPAVARQLVHVMAETGLLTAARAEEAFSRADGDLPESPDVQLVSSGDMTPLTRLYGLIYK